MCPASAARRVASEQQAREVRGRGRMDPWGDHSGDHNNCAPVRSIDVEGEAIRTPGRHPLTRDENVRGSPGGSRRRGFWSNERSPPEADTANRVGSRAHVESKDYSMDIKVRTDDKGEQAPRSGTPVSSKRARSRYV